MTMDYIENIAQLLAILISLLIALFGYIGTKRVGWLFAVIFFLSDLMSSYFWTAYLVIMGETPDDSDALTYFGWNIAFLFLFFLIFNIKSREERRYFNPVMLLPIPLNIWQLILYLDFDNQWLSIYQVTICTLVSCFCLQGVMWYFKNRKNGGKPPFVEIAALLFVTFEFGMWTHTCFDSWASDLYYPFSFLNSLSMLLLVWAIKKHYDYAEDDSEMLVDKKIQNIMKVAYVVIVLLCSLGGIWLGGWLRDVLTAGMADTEETGVYTIIAVILFLISAIIVAFAIAIILIVYFEQKIAENNKLKEARALAEQSNSAKSDFLASMSHEIRTPINAVLGMNEMILNESLRARDGDLVDREETRKIFSDIVNCSGNIDNAGNNLLSIINDILDLSKIEAGKMEINEDNYQLSSVLNDVSNMIRFKAEAKGLKFTVDVEESLPDGLYGDELRVRQVITNILNNAVKYTNEGSVTLSIRGNGVPVYEKGDVAELVVIVKDTGIGIKEEDLGKLFGKFERMDIKKNSTVEGTGLGLAITQNLVEMMGGSVDVESKYGKGSVFTIHLAQKVISVESVGDFREKFKKSMEETTAVDVSYHAPEARVLIVDDTQLNLMVAQGLLKETMIQVETADSGARSLEMTKKTHYDIIMMDQRMPEMDGTETLKRLREQTDGANPDTPVICLTADAIAGAKEKYTKLGFTDYLSKPIDGRKLREKVRRYLPQEKVQKVADSVSEDLNPEKKKPEKAVVSTSQEVVREEPKVTLTSSVDSSIIDMKKGMGYCGNEEELYRALMDDFLKRADEKKDLLQKSFEEEDWKNYGIQVHSVKSTAMTIGAVALSGAASELEKQAMEGNADAIRKSHPDMLERYREAVEAVKTIVS